MALIYLIDDDEDFRFFAQRAIELFGHAGRAFSDSRDALMDLRVTAEIPRLVLVDYRMPGLGAAEFIVELRRDARGDRVRVILVSGVSDLARVADGIGADGFLPKPFDLAAVEKLLTAQLNAP